MDVQLNSAMPNYLAHYYEGSIGPFVNLSDLPYQKANKINQSIREEKTAFASKRSEDYLLIRNEIEAKVRSLFIMKGGEPQRKNPHYMILGSCNWVKSWYRDGKEIKIPLQQFDPKIISFTYGDTFPATRYQNGKPYRGKIFILDELTNLVQQYGLPQDWNKDGRLGPDRYIEAQIWSDEPLKLYLHNRY